MIGGGEFTSFQPGAVMDGELIVRSAQVHALMPMMQFSVAPWRVLSPEELDAVLKSVKLREKFKDYILATAKASANSGEPILRPLEYNFPGQGFEKTVDRFMIGDQLLVAPVTGKGQTEIAITLPEGTWQAFDGKSYQGGQTIQLPAALNVLPYFQLK